LWILSSTRDGGTARFSLWRFETAGGVLNEVLELTPAAAGSRFTGLAVSDRGGFYEIFFSEDDDDNDDEDEFIWRMIADGSGGVSTAPEVYSGPRADPADFPPRPTDGIDALLTKHFSPTRLAVDRLGNLVVSDPFRQRIRGIEQTTQLVDTVVGWYAPGDGEVAAARLGSPRALEWDELTSTWIVGDAVGQPFVSPQNGTLRSVDLSTGSLTTLIGQDRGVFPRFFSSPLRAEDERLRDVPALWVGSNGPPEGLAVDPSTGDLFYSDRRQNELYRVTRSDSAVSEWRVGGYTGFDNIDDTVAGAVDGARDVASFREPTGLALDPENRLLYLADTGNHTIRVVDLDLETVGTLAGTAGVAGYAADGVVGGLGDALLSSPTQLALACDGSLYVSDTGNNRVRRIDLSTNTISTVLGNGSGESTGEGARADTLPVERPGGLTFDAFGNLFVSSTQTLRAVAAGDDALCPDGSSLPTGEDAAFTVYGAPPRDSFPQTDTRCLSAVAADPARDDRLFAIDACQGFFIELTR
ncbi:MAG: hypothetical protein AAFQ82_19990, partial [Myxococcota bacterium]